MGPHDPHDRPRSVAGPARAGPSRCAILSSGRSTRRRSGAGGRPATALRLGGRSSRRRGSDHRAGGAMPGDWNFATCWEAIADARPDAPALIQGDRADRRWAQFEERSARLARRVRRARARPRRQGRELPLQLPRVPRGHLRDLEAAGRPGQRELPLPRGGAALPARELRRRGAALPRRARRAGRQGPRPGAEAARDRAGRRRHAAPRRRDRLRGPRRTATSRPSGSADRATTSTSSTPAAPRGCPRA